MWKRPPARRGRALATATMAVAGAALLERMRWDYRVGGIEVIASALQCITYTQRLFRHLAITMRDGFGRGIQ